MDAHHFVDHPYHHPGLDDVDIGISHSNIKDMDILSITFPSEETVPGSVKANYLSMAIAVTIFPVLMLYSKGIGYALTGILIAAIFAFCLIWIYQKKLRYAWKNRDRFKPENAKRMWGTPKGSVLTTFLFAYRSMRVAVWLGYVMLVFATGTAIVGYYDVSITTIYGQIVAVIVVPMGILWISIIIYLLERTRLLDEYRLREHSNT